MTPTVIAAVVAPVVAVTVDSPVHSVSVLRIPLLHLSPAGTGGVLAVVMVVVLSLVVRNLPGQREFLSILEQVRVPIARQKLFVNNSVNCVIIGRDCLPFIMHNGNDFGHGIN